MSHLASPLGPITISADREGICAVQFGLSSEKSENSEIARTAARQLREYLSGQRRTFTLPLSPRGTPFQCSVWRAASEIPFGRVSTYGEIAKRIGRPRAARAVGNALNRNPFLILVPCHRVIPSTGGIGNYAADTHCKRWLLQHESRR